jgi:hypothetical protein
MPFEDFIMKIGHESTTEGLHPSGGADYTAPHGRLSHPDILHKIIGISRLKKLRGLRHTPL